MKSSIFRSVRAVRRYLPLFCMAALLLAGGAFADTLITSNPDDPNNGEADQTQKGEISKVTRDEVVIKDKTGLENKIPAQRILETHYENEPISLQVVRTAVDAAQYEDALRKVVEIPENEKKNASEWVQQEIDFYFAQTSALLALSGHPEMKLSTAVSRLSDFIKKNGESWHYYEANRLIGQVLTADGKVSNAKPYYENLSNAPWPDTHTEGLVRLAMATLDEGDYESAESALNTVLNLSDTGIDRQKNYARIGLAKMASLRKEHDKAKQLFNELIGSSDPDDIHFQAALYNAMGEAAERAGDPKGAVTAYLHVDLLYSAASAEHIEALRHLVTLWKQQLREDRAAEAQAILKDQYKLKE